MKENPNLSRRSRNWSAISSTVPMSRNGVSSASSTVKKGRCSASNVCIVARRSVVTTTAWTRAFSSRSSKWSPACSRMKRTRSSASAAVAIRNVPGGCPGSWSAPATATVSARRDRKSTRLNSSHVAISYAVFCLKKKKEEQDELVTEKKRKQTDYL